MNLDSSARKRPQRLKEKLREAALAAILEAAEAVVLEQGLDAPMELIASRAGVAVGTLYNHFADRRALLDSLLARHRETLLSQVRAAEARTGDRPVHEQLLAMLTAMSSGWARIFLVMRQGERIPDAKKRAEFRQRFDQLFGDVLARGRKQGVIAADPDGLQSVTLEGLIKATFVFAVDNPKRLPLADAPGVVVAHFLNGVALKRAKK